MAVSTEQALLQAARAGREDAFEPLVEPYRGELHAHCYRMLGSVHDAEDAVQEALLRSWRGLKRFEGRSSLRSWLYKIATNTCLNHLAKRPKRVLPVDYGPSWDPHDGVGEPVVESVWIEPYPDAQLADGAVSPEARYEQRESVELAFVAALQHLAANQRAALILREVLGFSAAEVAGILDTTPASVNSALQRARKAVDQRVPRTAQRAELDALGADGRRDLVDAFVTAWERADVAAILELLAEDVRFTMPPLPAWFRGREDIGRFFTERMFATPWRLLPIRATGQLAFACYQGDPDGDRFRLGAVNVVSVRAGRIVEMAGFLEPGVHRRFGLPDELPKR
jgi:RNA polymerase sigma-70 factor (TIGR02960 family)